MKIIVLDADRREFNGKVYTRFGRYFRSAREFLHRAVWMYHNGPVPDGHHVHHVNDDRDDNRIENLEIMEGRAHLSMHHKGHTRTPHAAIEAARVWRTTDEGQQFSSELGKRNAHFMHEPRAFVCEQCGETYRANPIGTNRFCGYRCKHAWQRAVGADKAERTCIVCTARFRTNRWRPAQTCSPKCRGVISGNARRGVPQRK